MVVRNTKKKSTAMDLARMARKRGLKASIFKKKIGYGVSMTRKK